MYLTENPWPAILLCGIAAVLALILWYQRKQAAYLGGVLLAIILAAGIWYAERLIVTEKERIAESIYAVTAAFQEGKLDETLSFISEQASDIRNLVAFGYNLVEVGDDMRVTDVEVELTGQETRATSRFRVNATITAKLTGYSQHQPTRWETKWQLEGSDWKIIDVKQLDPITGERIDRFSRYRRMIPNISK